MPIAALPPSTVRAIGSTSIISDPYSLTKELLDNALDASASSIKIEISQDTIDTIQVKDNGYGIPASDYPLVCKRTFTSKIHTVEDLKNIGGKSLGFRGEALASAAEIAGTLTVSTRVDSEPVGSSLKYGRNGELTSTERLAHPVGTTVRVSNLFRQIPVRRQTAVKNSKKTILRIRKMIQAYAMARPLVRLAFKVLKAKNESGNWMYAPGKDATFVDAALKVAGTEVAANCAIKEWPTAPLNEGESRPAIDSSFKLVALLPELGSDFTKFNNLGQYISVDGRPVSASRGIAQDIAKLYKSYIRSASSRDGLSPTITDPFLCIHILCPDGAYDVNIEPSKDDVLFEDQQTVTSLVENLLRDSYGTSDHDMLGHDAEAPHLNGSGVLLSTGQLLSTSLAHRPMNSAQGSGFARAGLLARPEQSFRSSPVPKPRPGTRLDRSPFVRFNNARASDTFPVIDIQNPRHHSLEESQTQMSPRLATQNGNHGSCFPSPISCSDSTPANNTSHSPLFRRSSTSSPGSTQLSPTTPVQASRQEQRTRDKERYDNGSLDTWFLGISQGAQIPAASEDIQSPNDEPSLSELTQDRFGGEQSRPNGPPGSTDSFSSQLMNETPDSQRQETQKTPSQSSAPPSTRPARTVSKDKGLPVLEQWSARLYNTPTHNVNPELQKALEFETRKKAAIQERRLHLRGSAASTSTNSPHQNRYLAALSALNSRPGSVAQQSGLEKAGNTNEAPAFKSILSSHDPRAYLMCFQNGDSGNLKRITTNKLPFEKIPDRCNLHSVGLALPTDLPSIHSSFKRTAKNDIYTQSGHGIEGFSADYIDADISIWSSRLTELMRAQYKSSDDDNVPNLQYDFSSISKSSLTITERREYYNSRGLPSQVSRP
ncbi:hypothetical protein BDV06DRAFT_234479 [Aspergillus oleicola]